jgi:hypothetical protein
MREDFGNIVVIIGVMYYSGGYSGYRVLRLVIQVI